MTFGPWLFDVSVGPPGYVSVAVDERFFQTTFGSCPRVFALASTTSVRIVGIPSDPAATVPRLQVIVPPEIAAVLLESWGSRCVNVVPSGAGTVTTAFVAAESV